MKWVRCAVVVVLVGIAIAVPMFWSVGPKEPSYNGRSLSSWLEEWSGAYNDRTNPAATAIRAMGSNGLPILLARVSTEEPREERILWRILSQVVPDNWDPFNRDTYRAVTAAEAINLLGVEAKPAFPTLTNLFLTGPHCLTAGIGLAGIGHEGVAVLLNALTNQDWVRRHHAAVALGEARSDTNAVVAALIEVVRIGGHTEQDNLVRGAAGRALAQLHQEPNLVVPVFAEFLTNQDAHLRVLGASLLAGFGRDAKAAVPLLLKARTDADPEVRETAERALEEIDPEAADKTGLK
jgi:HEAT repeat protein